MILDTTTFIVGMIRYVLSAYLHRKLPGMTAVKSLVLMTACWTYARALMMVMMTTRVTESASDDDTDYRPVISTKKCRLVKDSFKMHLEDARKRYSLKVPSRYKIMTTV